MMENQVGSGDLDKYVSLKWFLEAHAQNDTHKYISMKNIFKKTQYLS